jgi:hypothetical protein
MYVVDSNPEVIRKQCQILFAEVMLEFGCLHGLQLISIGSPIIVHVLRAIICFVFCRASVAGPSGVQQGGGGQSSKRIQQTQAQVNEVCLCPLDCFFRALAQK